MEEKKFITPLLEVVDFANDDIITLSGGVAGSVWSEDDNSEPWRNN